MYTVYTFHHGYKKIRVLVTITNHKLSARSNRPSSQECQKLKWNYVPYNASRLNNNHKPQVVCTLQLTVQSRVPETQVELRTL